MKPKIRYSHTLYTVEGILAICADGVVSGRKYRISRAFQWPETKQINGYSFAIFRHAFKQLRGDLRRVMAGVGQ